MPLQQQRREVQQQQQPPNSNYVQQPNSNYNASSINDNSGVYNSATGLQTGNLVPINKWNHVAITKDNDNIKIYLNK